MKTFDEQEFDRFLSEVSEKPNWIKMHPLTWNGFWYIKPHSLFWGRVFRKLGRLLKSRRIYWLGLPIVWLEGYKEYFNPSTTKVYDIYDENGHTVFVELKD